MIVVADTGPINYLILIGEIEVLPALYESWFQHRCARNSDYRAPRTRCGPGSPSASMARDPHPARSAR
ncbi:hypothetical protein SBA3_1940021 [Candidatus Sulfopaludibacter sp. SbA3]|nr:hypothetical protein SBA3_1940021 [Candidatus Sulfopaludibacter sp. SbA3]